MGENQYSNKELEELKATYRTICKLEEKDGVSISDGQALMQVKNFLANTITRMVL